MSTWLRVKSNEHTVLLPLLIYALNTHLTGGDNLALSALAVGLAGVALVLLLSAMPATLRAPPILRLAVSLFLSVMVFAPVVAHNIVMGFSGTMWLLANTFTVASVVMLQRSSRSPSPAALTAVVLLAIGASLSFSIGLSVFPSLLLGAISPAAAARPLPGPARRPGLPLADGGPHLLASGPAPPSGDRQPAAPGCFCLRLPGVRGRGPPVGLPACSGGSV